MNICKINEYLDKLDVKNVSVDMCQFNPKDKTIFMQKTVEYEEDKIKKQRYESVTIQLEDTEEAIEVVFQEFVERIS